MASNLAWDPLYWNMGSLHMSKNQNGTSCHFQAKKNPCELDPWMAALFNYGVFNLFQDQDGFFKLYYTSTQLLYPSIRRLKCGATHSLMSTKDGLGPDESTCRKHLIRRDISPFGLMCDQPVPSSWLCDWEPRCYCESGWQFNRIFWPPKSWPKLNHRLTNPQPVVAHL